MYRINLMYTGKVEIKRESLAINIKRNGIGNTYFFLSKLGTKIREVYLPTDSSTIWDRCDVLITANPSLLNGKPEGKTAIRIEKEYNKDCPCDYHYETLSLFLTDENIIEKLLEK